MRLAHVSRTTFAIRTTRLARATRNATLTFMQTRHRSKPAAFPRNPALIAATALATLLALAACKPAAPGGAKARGGRSGQGGPVPVQVATATRQTIPITRTDIGYVQPLRTVSVRSQVDGTIEKIHFREGDEVRAGDLLVTIDRRPFENALRIARAALDNARAQDNSAQTDLARYEKLYHTALVSKEDYDQYRTKAETARAALASAQAAVANAELQLGYTEIRAPITGRTGQFGLHQGALVKANDSSAVLLTINQIAPISVAFSIPENILVRVRAAAHTPGAMPDIRVTAAPRDAAGPAAEGRLDFIDNAVDTSTGTIVLKAKFPNTDHALWPGEFVNVRMELGHETDAILVPSAAIQPGQDGKQLIYIIAPDTTAQIRAVKTGRTENGLTVILDGVTEGETVVTDGHIRLTEGAKTTIKTLEDFIK